jgi:predicted MFS family arabinose efflux permease
MLRDLHCSEFQATVGIAVYCLGYAVVPMFTSPLSEEFGRMPLYIISTIGFALTHLMVALYVLRARRMLRYTDQFLVHLIYRP